MIVVSLTSRIKKQAFGLSQRALERVFADEGRAQRLAQAMGTVQRGKRAVDATQTAVMHQLNFATKGDFKALGKALSGVKKRVRSLDEKLSKVR